MTEKINAIIANYNHDKTRLVDMLRDIQISERMISDEAIAILSAKLKISQVDIRETATFYHFLSRQNTGEFTIYLNNGVSSELSGFAEVKEAFEHEVGCQFGHNSKANKVGLRLAACIGMCDQEPSALINGVPYVSLTPDKARKIIRTIRAKKNPHELNMNTVLSNIRKRGEVLLSPYQRGKAIATALAMPSEKIINEIKTANLVGRGGAGFPTGMKWQFAAAEKNETKYLICNADEGEPGTFKDRVLLTEVPGLLFEGMVTAAYAIGATHGIIYLRMEYSYLVEKLNKELEGFRKDNLLGKKIAGSNFNFDIEIRLGAGAYVCGEETALIESLEGKRGEPRNKPPFPIQSGFLGKPTLVNNVETLCAAAKIVKNGGTWYKKLGTEKTSGTKLLSVSGDVESPGIYEIEWGLTIGDFLKMVGAKDPRAIVVGGPSGKIIAASDVNRKIATEDLPTAGAMVVINRDRDLISIVHNYMKFFTDESCGACLPCRGGNVLITDIIEKIRNGLGDRFDLEKLVSWSKIIKATSRCGLGQTSSQPILSTLDAFRDEYEKRVDMKTDGMIAPFDLKAASASYDKIFKV